MESFNMAETDYYEKLCKYYEIQTGPILNKERLKDGLRQTVSPEELQLFFFVPFQGTVPLDKIAQRARRLKLSRDELKSRLDRLHKEAFLIRYDGGKETTYERAFSAYMAEQQVRMRQNTELGQVYAQFWFDLANHSAKNLPTRTPYYRVLAVEETVKEPGSTRRIEINQEVQDPRTALPIDIISEMVSREPLIAVSECYCRLSNRLIGNECDYPMETCFTFNELGAALIDIGTARQVDAEEAVQILRECEEAGLVHNVDNCEEHLKSLCNCCSCHCPAMHALERGQTNVSAPSRFEPGLDEEACTLCGVCIERCPLKVISQTNGSLAFDRTNCIGCGLCASGCPENALRMALRDKAPRMAKTNDDLWNKIRREAIIGMIKSKIFGN
jgi:Pyruvate/2-oxoacid:ferredoxin oxidoreductase delta subunit